MKKHHHTEGACLLLDEPWLYLDIRDLSEGSHVEAIIDGTNVCQDNTNPAVKTCLRQLQLPTTVSDKQPPTKYIESCKIEKESKSSQGAHIRLYKVAAQYLLLGWIFQQKSEIPYLSGYSFRRNCTGTDVMLPKKRTPGMRKTCALLSYLTLKKTILTNLL